MAPEKKLNQSIYNGGLDVGIVSENDGSSFGGSFGSKTKPVRRDLAEASSPGVNHEDDDANRMSFKPFVAEHDEYGMLVHIQFDDPNSMSVMGEGSVNLKIKELSIFKTKETMTSLTTEAFRDGQP